MIKEAINNDAWAIMPSSLDNISTKVIAGVTDPVITDEVAEGADGVSYVDAKAAFMSQFEERLQVDSEGRGYISIDGPMMLNPGPFERVAIGAADMGRISELVRVAAAEEEVTSLVLSINSPGGTVVGTPELAQSIRDFNSTGKKSVAFTNSLMASAAYWVGSQCSEVVCTESAIVGSVGVIRSHVDLTEARAQAGVKVEVFRGGDNKVAGAYSTEMTDDQRKLIQEGIDEKHAEFQSVVSEARGIDESLLDGRTFYGAQAAKNGFADTIVSSFSGLVSSLKASDQLAANADDENPQVDNLREDMSNPAEKNESAPEAEIAVGEIAVSETVAQGQADEFVTLEDTNDESSEDATVTVHDDSADGDVADADEGEGSEPVVSDELVNEEVELSPSEEGCDSADTDADEADEGSELSSRVDEISSKLDALIAALAPGGDEEASGDSGADDASFEERVDEAAEAKAAKIAADSGVESIEATGEQGDSSKYANFTDAQLWVEHSNIMGKEGEAAAREFYVNNIRNK